MKLNMPMVEARLKRCKIESNIQSIACTIRGVRFLTDQQSAYSHDYVYIGSARDFFRDPRYADGLILASGRNHIVCQGLEYEELLNCVLSAFDFFNDLENRLVMMAARHAPLSDMIEEVAHVIDAPFLVFGIDGTYLGGSHIDLLRDEALAANIREHGSLGAGVIGSKFVSDSGAVPRDISTKPTATYGPDGQSAVSMYLNDGRETIGFAMCFPLRKAHRHLAFSLEPFFAKFLISAREFVDGTSSHQALHMALSDLLQDKDISEDAVNRIGHALGAARQFNVVLVRSLSIANRTQRLLLAREIGELPLSCIAAEIGEAVAFLVWEQQTEELIAQVLSRFEPDNVIIGVSMLISSVDRAPVALRQAEFACNEQDAPGVRHCKDLALPFLLRTLRNEPSTQDLLHPALGIIAAYDAGHHSDLGKTLKTYLETGCNQVEAAKRLHVHLNTLKYRLKRIEELTDLDTRNNADVLYLQISIELERLSLYRQS